VRLPLAARLYRSCDPRVASTLRRFLAQPQRAALGEQPLLLVVQQVARRG
jgi:hypothetical protein